MGRTSKHERKPGDQWLVPVVGRIVFIAGLLVSALDRAIHQQGGFVLTAKFVLGIASLIVGLGLYLASRLYLGRFFSEKVRIIQGHKLVAKGPYRYIRHPVYLGEMLYFLSIPAIFGSLLGFVIMLTIVPILIYRIGYEEKVLSTEFGQEYEDYASRTWKLIPFLY
ncbi:MAG: isoprenylcysteine carboxylmethyltransferase family protein [Methanomassiliicoccus sp.]|nr:isoprenylcysteine carboxylmethyltransferase family protein [Methanomassiliicoccus sp.]